MYGILNVYLSTQLRIKYEHAVAQTYVLLSLSEYIVHCTIIMIVRFLFKINRKQYLLNVPIEVDRHTQTSVLTSCVYIYVYDTCR